MGTGAPPPPDAGARPSRARPGLIAAVAAAVVVVALVVWLIARDGDDDGSPGSSAPVAASAEDLAELSRSVDHPVYWAGAQSGVTYELTRAAEGRVFVRYLPPGVGVGDPRPQFLTVGTYPMPDGYGRLRAVSTAEGATRRRIPNGGLAVVGADRPTSAYFAYPDADYQVEVFDPKPRRALKLITSGRITPIR